MKAVAFVLPGLVGFVAQRTHTCEWGGEFPSLICAAGSFFAQFLSVIGIASLVSTVVARRCGADEETFTFVVAVCWAVALFVMLSRAL
ncbi:hypothetical protein ACFSHT_36785 [Paraburkholderia silviterrae]|uniref:Uncharacterized protein n=1 Tax=Paraburkholderia silviterrae TaxID=2528715 RepID=A0A4R5M6K7_9BURK|nr:hypothetical protein [Paraburkholderia silviterrae]TDG21758.1 hypothetical protein EYW47_20560 [Paraburkholderia silviterrae]